MRVIAGQYKGRSLKAPAGIDTRPTTDRVRESLFSALASARGGFDGAVVLDAFAGSGALGIEALSRGASFACLCDCNRLALQALGSNTQFLSQDCFRVARIDIEKRLPPMPSCPPASQPSYDLLFFDPPYAFDIERVCRLGMRLDEAGLIAPGAILSYEHAATTSAKGVTGNPTSENSWLVLQWQLINTRTIGDTTIDLYRRYV